MTQNLRDVERFEQQIVAIGHGVYKLTLHFARERVKRCKHWTKRMFTRCVNATAPQRGGCRVIFIQVRSTFLHPQNLPTLLSFKVFVFS
jgi:hypothetical protein